MSDIPTPNPEQLNSPETTSTSELDKAVDRIFTDYGAAKHEDAEGSHEELPLGSLGTTLIRSTDTEGNVSYELTTLWHTTTDRGIRSYKWASNATSIKRGYDSEMEGYSDEEPGGADAIKAIQSRLEREFPIRVEMETAPRVNVFRRLLGKVGVRKYLGE